MLSTINGNTKNNFKLTRGDSETMEKFLEQRRSGWVYEEH